MDKPKSSKHRNVAITVLTIGHMLAWSTQPIMDYFKTRTNPFTPWQYTTKHVKNKNGVSYDTLYDTDNDGIWDYRKAGFRGGPRMILPYMPLEKLAQE